jgi:GNAT superfamily N-acetyltransferase
VAARIVRVGAERIDDLEPLWKALVEHQASIDPRPRGVPVRTPEDSWPYRRAEYRRWLAEPGAFALIAEDEHADEAVGYALVSIREPADDHWVTLERWAELQSLVVLPPHRNEGLGSRLVDAVHQELRGAGIRELVIGVVATNEDALRFYGRFGYRPWIVELLGRIPDA